MKQLTLILCLVIAPLSFLYGQCTDDCVWPGDLNANGIANQLDILALGLAWGQTGPPRTNTTTNWEPLEAEDWAGSLPLLGSNFKHCDGDGDGELTSNDQFSISINYNQTNPNFTGLLGNELEGDDLFLVPQNTVSSPGASLIFDVHLGTAANPIVDLHGVGFQLDMDTQYVSDVLFDFSDSWIGSDDDILGYGKYTGGLDHAATAITRLDGNTVSGFGKIAQIEIVIIDVILALEMDSTACLPFSVYFKNVLGIDLMEEDLMIRSRGDSLTIKHPSQLTSSTTNEATKSTQVAVFPNPVKDRLYIQTTEAPIHQIRLWSPLGQTVFQQKISNRTSNQKQFDFSLSTLPSGFYFLEIDLGTQKVIRKILLE